MTHPANPAAELVPQCSVFRETNCGPAYVCLRPTHLVDPQTGEPRCVDHGGRRRP